ncbi:vascular endothelial growth factor receptor 1 isoform X2 [Leguminivora glycinivorella]|uniref:vascular endothelial growth factor receptor 1 isoform X2 n=1 Tax=Leguminivora glycinivorella TaxID=1035111 RepID=UPI00200BFAEB|nr:vascular endothelial growth factor receptor 1 isoform X2 [Leguminivora glycinivorella]
MQKLRCKQRRYSLKSVSVQCSNMFDLLGWYFVAILVVISDAQQISGPIIMSPNEILLQYKQNYTIHCKGKRPINFTIQEAAEDEETDFKKILRKVAPSDNEYEYEIALDLYSVDPFSVGYYACHDDTVDPSQIFNELVEEPTNNEHISYTYVYVNDPQNIIAPMREIVYVVKPGAKTIIGCRPTYPDVQVNLTMNVTQQVKTNQNKIVRINKIGFLVRVRKTETYTYTCEGRRGNRTERKSAHINIRTVSNDAEKPLITVRDNRFLAGETIFMNCTVNYTLNNAISLRWITPQPLSEENVKSNEFEIQDTDVLYRAIWVKHATEKDAGEYICEATKGFSDITRNTHTMTFLKTPYLKLKLLGPEKAKTENRQFTFAFRIEGYPIPEYKFFKNNNTIINNGTKYNIEVDKIKVIHKLRINDVDITDTGEYTVQATNSNGTQRLSRHLNVYDVPRITFNLEGRFLKGQQRKLKCVVTGYPLPDVEWSFIDGQTNEELDTPLKGTIEEVSEYKVVSTLDIQVQSPGTVICRASNTRGKNETARPLLVDEIEGGFGIEHEGKEKEVSEGDRIILRCLASRYDYTSVRWVGPNEEIPGAVFEQSTNAMSLVSKMEINDALISHTGNYSCIAYNNITSKERIETISVVVAGLRAATIKVPAEDTDKEVIPFDDVTLTCVAEAIPPPVITWYKDDIEIPTKNIITRDINYSTVNSTYSYKQNGTDDSVYECVATSGTSRVSRVYRTTVKMLQSHFKWEYLSILVAIMLALVFLVLYLCWKIKKEKRFRKELAAAGLLYFKEGAPKSLNPELGIDEQAELLPYDDKFEFPVEKLILGPQLGAGAFGVVYKAEARGIINAEDSTTVAVKMVKKTADNIYIKALASELKIMVHLGKHINIVNLLGACTKNVGKRELIVIVEFCKFGNIHNYMQRHRDVFIDQLTDNQEKGNINRGFCGNDSGMTSDCLNTNQTQNTDHTFLNTAASNRSGRLDKPKPQSESEKVSESGYVQPEWRSNYESDYVYEGRKPRPLTSRDLLAWAFQIARGMEYLASMKILHGDLAARNILLAEDNVVKICDFGLARSIYKNDEYQKKENSPLPVKWLAIECMTDRIFSTQSDVWSFGIVLWELFSLAKTPYPEISPQDLLQRLQEGHRLSKPPYADDRLYRVMRSCWEQRPTKRPTFTTLQETIGSFLEDNVRNHYVELNQSCADTNADRVGENYLVQVCAPDYNNQVTPSPHHYANDASGFFFGVTPSPTPQLQHDDEGYLAMTPASNQNIFSPRVGATFDFDARKLNGRSSASSQGSELTPMLSLNHLTPSDSDEPPTSPYLNMIPRIEEETDEGRAGQQRWRYRHT